MTLVDQTLFVDTPGRQGNCLSACVATYLGIPLSEVPHFAEYESDTPGNAWWDLLTGFMAGYGQMPVDLDDPGDADPGEWVFVTGPSDRGTAHVVLYRDGQLFHDPHPSRAGLRAVSDVTVYRPCTHDHEPHLDTQETR